MSGPLPELPLRAESDDEWLNELLTPAAASALVYTVAASSDEGETEHDWLVELLGAHRRGGCQEEEGVVEPKAAAPRGGHQVVVVEPVEPRAALPEGGHQQGVVEPMAAPLGGGQVVVEPRRSRSRSRSRGRQVVVEPMRRAALPGATATSSTSAARNMATRSRSRGATESSSSGQAVVSPSSSVQVVFRNWQDVSEHMANSAVPPAAYQTWTLPGQDTIVLSGLKCITLSPPGHVGPWSPFDYAVGRLLAWKRLLGMITFKVGIASDTADRWHNSAHGYGAEGCWHFMDAVLEGPADRCRELEIALISACRGISGCQNERPGGEGISPTRTHMCRVYMVFAEAGLGVGLQAACQHRRQYAQRVPAQSSAVFVRMDGFDMMSGGC